MSCAFAGNGAVILTILMEITAVWDAVHPGFLAGPGAYASPPESGLGVLALPLLISYVTIPLGAVLGLLTATVIRFSQKSEYRKAAIYCFSIGAGILFTALSCLFVLEYPAGVHFEVFWWPINIWAAGITIYGVVAANKYRDDKRRAS